MNFSRKPVGQAVLALVLSTGLGACATLSRDGGEAEVRQAADVFARQGMRVLGVARSTHSGPDAHSTWPALQKPK